MYPEYISSVDLNKNKILPCLACMYIGFYVCHSMIQNPTVLLTDWRFPIGKFLSAIYYLSIYLSSCTIRFIYRLISSHPDSIYLCPSHSVPLMCRHNQNTCNRAPQIFSLFLIADIEQENLFVSFIFVECMRSLRYLCIWIDGTPRRWWWIHKCVDTNTDLVVSCCCCCCLSLATLIVVIQ